MAVPDPAEGIDFQHQVAWIPLARCLIQFMGEVVCDPATQILVQLQRQQLLDCPQVDRHESVLPARYDALSQ